MQRRRVAEALALLLAGCGGPGAPPPPRRHLPFDPPEAAPPRAPDGQTWQLVEPLRLPAYADRDDAGAWRWAEPLRDALPRVLRTDLGAWRGERVWGSPLPSGVPVTHRLRVEVLALETGSAGLRLAAQWTLEDARGSAPPRAGAADLRLPQADLGAHRLALWRLAGAIVGTGPAAPTRERRPDQPA